MWQLTCWQIFFFFLHLHNTTGQSWTKPNFCFLPPKEHFIGGGFMALWWQTPYFTPPPPQSPNLSNQSQKLCYEEAIKLNIRPNTCRLADCFPGHKGCFITNVLMFGMEKLLYQISEFISLQTRFLSNKRAISYTLIHVGLITAY